MGNLNDIVIDTIIESRWKLFLTDFPWFNSLIFFSRIRFLSLFHRKDSKFYPGNYFQLAELEWLKRLERTLCSTLCHGFESHQCASKSLDLRNPRTQEIKHTVRDPPWLWRKAHTYPEVRNKGVQKRLMSSKTGRVCFLSFVIDRFFIWVNYSTTKTHSGPKISKIICRFYGDFCDTWTGCDFCFAW